MTPPLDRIARLRTDWAKATPAPWVVSLEVGTDQAGYTEEVWIAANGATVAELGESYTNAPTNADLIVRLRNAAETQLDQLQGVFERHEPIDVDLVRPICTTCEVDWTIDTEGCPDYRAALAVLDKLDPPGGDT